MEPFETLTVAMAKSVEERMEVGNLKQLHFMDIIRCFALFLPLLLYDQVSSPHNVFSSLFVSTTTIIPFNFRHFEETKLQIGRL